MDTAPPNSPRLSIRDSAGATRAVVLLLPGGRADSRAPLHRRHLAWLRMRMFGPALRRSVPDAAIWLLRYRYRGWNGAAADPVVDARWALDQIRTRHGSVPTVIVGHSMGGRAALRLVGDPGFVGVVGLAPWLPDGEPEVAAPGRRLHLVHGSADRWTDPGGSRARVGSAARAGMPARWTPMPGHGHFMLRRPGRWHRLTAASVAEMVQTDGPGVAGTDGAGHGRAGHDWAGHDWAGHGWAGQADPGSAPNYPHHA